MPGNYSEHTCSLSCPAYHYYPKTHNENAVGDVFGFPDWLFHPIEASKCFFRFVFIEAENYGVLPFTLIAGGLAIYYLKNPRETQ